MSKSPPPQILQQVSWKKIAHHSFRTTPITFNSICVCSCCRVNEVLRMVHCLMSVSGDTNITVSSPFIGYDGGAWPNVLCYDRHQSVLAPIRHHHHEQAFAASFDELESYIIPSNYYMVGTCTYPQSALLAKSVYQYQTAFSYYGSHSGGRGS